VNQWLAVLVLLAIAIVAFAGSVRLGILLGRRIDRGLEASHESDTAEELDAAGQPEHREDELRD
jgi:hypothetical protein